MTIGEDSKVESKLQAATAQAAMLGTFNPLDFLNANDANELAALQQLATSCTEVLDGSQPLWQLSADARSRAFLRLKVSGTLEQVARAARPANSDRLGLFLKKILLGDEIRRFQLKDEDLGHLRTALQLAAPVAARPEDTTWIDEQVAKHDAEAAVQIVLPKKLIGRERQLKLLRQFVYKNTGLTDDFVLWLTGVGGIGKSALLAQFVRELRGKDWGGVPILTIDFDRPAFYQGRLSSIFLEISRQLELFRPQMAEALSEFREAVRRNEAKSGNERFHDRATSGIALLSAWKECLRAHLPIQGEVVIIFDTLEEVASSGNLSLAELTSWLLRLRAAGLPRLRPIFSGRAFYPEYSRGLPMHSQLALGDLTHAAAVKLLAAMLGTPHDIDVSIQNALVGMLGGNPLMLKILAVHLRDGGDTAARELLADRSNFDRRFAQTFLYKRLLGRIRTDDADLVKVAHPGLILRRVTPTLIQQVLADPCELGEISYDRAQDLFNKLSQQVWLVQASGENSVLHRKDLRRLMLQAMTATDIQKAQAVHASAAGFYSDFLDPVLTREQQRIEYFYHRLFTPAAELPPTDLVPAFVKSLGEDIETLPSTWRAALKVGSQKRLLAAEAAVLQEPDSVRYETEMERRAVLESGFAATSKAPDASSARGQDPRITLARAQTAFESGHLEPVVASADVAIQEVALPNQEQNSRDFTDFAVWRAAICSLRESGHFTKLLDRSVQQLDPQSLYRPLSFSSKGSLTVSGAYFMLYRLHGLTPPIQHLSGLQGGSTIDDVAALRYWQLGGEISERGSFAIRMRLLCDLSNAIEQLSDLQPAISLDRAGRNEYLQRSSAQSAMPTAVSLHALYGLQPREGYVLVDHLASLLPSHHTALRGLTPEIYPLVRAASRKCAAKVLLDYSEALSTRPYWPSDLVGAMFKRNLSEERERWTSVFIEVVDRHGLLSDFVNHLIERGRGTRHLMQVVRDYDSRIKDFFNPGLIAN